MTALPPPASPLVEAASHLSFSGVSSPVMAQYRTLKSAHPGSLLFFRLGDFYELFFEDAIVASEALDIALTKRGRDRGEDIPMCGVPVHNAEVYLHRLIRQGFKVAVADQLEDTETARKRPGRTLVRRDVVRIVTPGTLTEDSLLEPGRHNYLLALARVREGIGCAWVDISTGDFRTESIAPPEVSALLARVDPGEIVLAESLAAEPGLQAMLGEYADRLSPVRDTSFDVGSAQARLAAFFNVGTIDAFGEFGPAEIAAAGALLDYLELTQKGGLPRLSRPQRVETGVVLRLDPATRRNLELTASLAGGREGCLLTAIDRTRTAAGARLLAERLAAPLAAAAPIRDRLEQVDAFLDDGTRREEVRELLRRCPDLERALSRLTLGRGGPRDLAAIAEGLRRATAIAERLGGGAAPLAAFASALPSLTDLQTKLGRMLNDELPLQARDGGFIRRGTWPELDQLLNLRDSARKLILALEARYRDQTTIPSLKIRHNTQLGWFIEVTATHRGKVPDTFVQRQSMANAVRYTTPELAELESRIASAADRALALELELFEQLRQDVQAVADTIAAIACRLAEIDVASALAELARAQRWTRPAIDDKPRLMIRGGRHPVVEQALGREHKTFVGNDLVLDEHDRLWLLTGPNMAGKSTFLRQNALIVILAQIGSFVPAASAEIGVVDAVFSRVGAADDLARGRSTFMVEMVETAAILNQAGPRSFVILDEIGRGTATWDGLSLAWAVIEHLHDANRSLGLFATHYHELTTLAAKLDGLAPHTMRVKEWQNEVVFLHEVASGTADRSYGIHVAKLAGLPTAVTARAEALLHRLEAGELGSAPARLGDDLPLFAAAPPKLRASTPVRPAASPPSPPPAAVPSPIETELRRLDPDELTPKAALELVYRLKAMLAKGGTG